MQVDLYNDRKTGGCQLMHNGHKMGGFCCCLLDAQVDHTVTLVIIFKLYSVMFTINDHSFAKLFDILRYCVCYLSCSIKNY